MGICKLICVECQKSYIGQTGRQIQICYKEHIRCIRFNGGNWKFWVHILNNKERLGTHGKNYHKNDLATKGWIMNSKENLHMHLHRSLNKFIDEHKCEEINGLFDLLTDTYEGAKRYINCIPSHRITGTGLGSLPTTTLRLQHTQLVENPQKVQPHSHKGKVIFPFTSNKLSFQFIAWQASEVFRRQYPWVNDQFVV
jgi:hypothetical protein